MFWGCVVLTVLRIRHYVYTQDRVDSLPAARQQPPRAERAAYVLASFTNGRELGDGLRLLTSRDGRRWSVLPGEPVLLPLARTGGRVFRDPSVVWHGGRYHLVWTSDLCVGQRRKQWKCDQLPPKGRPLPRFGYAHSADLIVWEGIRLVEVALEGACSLWAPEIVGLPSAEGGGLMITFSATLALADKCPVNFKAHRHGAWSVRALELDAEGAALSFTPPRRLRVDPGESMIDLAPQLEARPAQPGRPPHLLFYKAEANACAHREWVVGVPPRADLGQCTLVLRQLAAWNASGPWLVDECARGDYFPGNTISRPCVEGPTPLQLDTGETLILFDSYRLDCTMLTPPPCEEARVGGAAAADVGLRPASSAPRGQCAYVPARKGFGALVSRDLCHWKDISGAVVTPEAYKHGTALALRGAARDAACASQASGPLAALCE